MITEALKHLSLPQQEILIAANAMDATLLITGNTGTGKSTLAELLHKYSPKRYMQRFHKINLATLSENLIESELFGHERGAFTGADIKRIGRLETCAGGTVFLDEIGELSLRLQAKLLDFIQYKKILPVGSNREIEIDVRIIAATNKNLKEAIQRGEFREDLYHRLNVFNIHLEKLNKNPDQIMLMAKKFLSEYERRINRSGLNFSPEVEALFQNYDWPGNIRELQNVIEFSVGMGPTKEIDIRFLPEYLRGNVQSTELKTQIQPSNSVSKKEDNASSRIELPISMDFHKTKEHFEKLYLEYALRVCRGQINLTSRSIGLNKVSLAEKIKRYSIDWRKIRYPSEQIHSTQH